MAFSASSPSSAVSEINVTPLIDVLLVLLIIFMVIVPVMPRGLDSSVPQDHPARPESSTSPLVLTLVSGTPVRYELNSREVAADELRSTLQRAFAMRQDRTLFVRGDRELSYGSVATTIGEARAAGAGAVGFMPKS